MKFYYHKKCSTCKSALDYLNNLGVDLELIDIVENNPDYETLKSWVDNYNIEVKKLFNTSGIKYRELNLKDKLKAMTIDESLKVLATDGMLVKRPILINENKIIIGKKLEEYKTL